MMLFATCKKYPGVLFLSLVLLQYAGGCGWEPIKNEHPPQDQAVICKQPAVICKQPDRVMLPQELQLPPRSLDINNNTPYKSRNHCLNCLITCRIDLFGITDMPMLGAL